MVTGTNQGPIRCSKIQANAVASVPILAVPRGRIACCVSQSGDDVGLDRWLPGPTRDVMVN